MTRHQTRRRDKMRERRIRPSLFEQGFAQQVLPLAVLRLPGRERLEQLLRVFVFAIPNERLCQTSLDTPVVGRHLERLSPFLDGLHAASCALVGFR